MRILIHCCFVMLIAIAVVSPVHGFTWGLNAAAGVSSFSKDVADTIATAGRGKYVVVLVYPNEVQSVYDKALSAGVNVIFRARHDNGTLTPASEWARTFSSLSTQPSISAAFMPVNEPNNAQERFSSPEPIRAHLTDLLKEWRSAGLSSKPGGVKLLSPALDTFQFYGNGGKAFYNALGGSELFSQFDGVALHMYAQMNKSGQFIGAFPALRGDSNALLSDMGLSGKPAYILETGATCEDCPGREGGSSVLYPFDTQGASLWNAYFQNAPFVSAGNIITAAPLIFQPSNTGKGRWIDTEAGKQVLAVMGMTASTGTPLEGVPSQNNNINAGVEQSNLPYGSRVSRNVDQTLRSSLGYQYRGDLAKCDGGVDGDDCLAKSAQDLGNTRQSHLTAGEPSERSWIKKTWDTFLSWFGFVSEQADKYTPTFLSQPTQREKVGGGGDETSTEHQTLMQALLPYGVRRAAEAEPVETPLSPPSPLPTSSPLVPPLTFPPGSSPVDAGRRLLEAAGTSPQIGWLIEGTRSDAVTSSTYRPSFCNAIGSSACTIASGSTQRFTYLQCVAFAQMSERLTGKELIGRNAKNYCTGTVPVGYTRFTYNKNTSPRAQLSPNDYIMWSNGKYGHIALVETVYDQQVTVLEANVPASGVIGRRLVPAERIPAISCVLRRN